MPSYTLAQLDDLLLDQLDGNGLLYPQAQRTQVLNDAVRKLNFLTGMIENTIPMLSLPNQLVYTMPAGILFPIKVYAESVELEKYSMRQLGTKYRNWATDSTAAYGPAARWAPIGVSQFVIHPQYAVGGRLIEVQGVAPVVPMVNADDKVDMDDEQVPVLIDYCRGRILLKLGGKPFASASTSYQRFIRELRDMVIWAGFAFPQYYIASALEPAEGKGA